jgi:hypothetical protein
MRSIAGALAVLCVLAASDAPAAPVAHAAAATADTQTAKAFVQGLYRPGGSEMSAWPRIFDAAMRKLMDEDRRLTPEGDEGALDFDPFCDCQDDADTKVEIAVTRATADAATVEARLGASRDRTVLFDLVRENGAWRVHDIASKSAPSLRKLFIDSNALAAKHR